MAKEWQNNEGYADPTAYQAMKNIKNDNRANELVSVLKWIANKCGFEFADKILLRDKRTGKIYKKG